MAKHGSLKKRRRKQINRERRKYIAEYVRMFGPLPSKDSVEYHGSISADMIDPDWRERREKAEAEAALAVAQRAAQV